jgi:hypothetical protein
LKIELCADDLFGHGVVQPACFAQTAALRARGARNHDHPIELRFGVGFKK